MYVYEKLTKDFHTFSVKADYKVPIEFIGYDSGTVDVTSLGSIRITKGVNNPLGSTSFKSTGGSIDSEGFTSINGQVINFEAAKGIGANSVIRTDLIGANSRLSAVTKPPGGRNGAPCRQTCRAGAAGSAGELRSLSSPAGPRRRCSAAGPPPSRLWHAGR